MLQTIFLIVINIICIFFNFKSKFKKKNNIKIENNLNLNFVEIMFQN